VEKDLGCRVYGFDPGLDFIDHYYSKNIRFFNARLSNKDQQAQYNVPGPPGWKYRKLLTLIKELHFDDVSLCSSSEWGRGGVENREVKILRFRCT
jgi:hypothetical protein